MRLIGSLSTAILVYAVMCCVFVIISLFNAVRFKEKNI
jgi:hypothetical protein